MKLKFRFIAYHLVSTKLISILPIQLAALVSVGIVEGGGSVPVFISSMETKRIMVG